MELSRNGCCIIEQFLDGREISCNLFLMDGEVRFSVCSNRRVVENLPGGIPKRHELPAVMSEKEAADTGALIEKMVKALNLKNGPVYLQLMITADGPRIIEAAPRLDGCHLWRLIKLATGVDLMAATFKLLQGLNVEAELKPVRNEPFALEFRHMPPESRFECSSFAIPRDALFSEVYYREGEKVRAINGRLEKVGYFIQGERT